MGWMFHYWGWGREMIFVCFLGRTTLVIDIAAMLDSIQWGVLLVGGKLCFFGCVLKDERNEASR